MPTHPLYWKLKALVLTSQAVKAQAEANVKAADEAVREAMAEAGLDPGGNYSLNDKDETITPAETPPITKM